jgi:hypothetical protein
MKTLPAITFVGALLAFAFLPLPFELAVSLLFATGMAGIVLGDYGRSARPLSIVAASATPTLRKERFGLAA